MPRAVLWCTRDRGFVVSRLVRRRQGDDGAVSVEFALILPVFLLVVFGAIQYGWYFFQVQEAAFAAREAARAASVGSIEPTGLTAFAASRISGVDAGAVTTEACFEDATGDTGGDVGNLSVADQLRIVVSFDATDFGFPFLPFPGSGTVSESGDARVEDVEPHVLNADFVSSGLASLPSGRCPITAP